MFAEYMAVVRALRRPMRRWWLSTGSWWLGVYVVCMLYRLFYAWQIHPYVWGLEPLAPPHAEAASDLLRPYVVLDHLLGLTSGLCFWCLWLAAAQYAIRLLDKLYTNRPSWANGGLATQRFLLGLMQGGWLLVVATSSAAAHNLLWQAWADAMWPERPAFGTMMELSNILNTPLESIQGFAWVTALLAVTVSRPLTAWLWTGATLMLAPVVYEASVLLRYLGSPTESHGVALTRPAFPAVWIIGLLIVIVMLGSFRARRLLLAYGLYAALLLSCCVRYCWGFLPLQHTSSATLVVASDVVGWSSGLSFRPAGFWPSFAVEEGASLGKLILWFPPATLSYSLPDYLCLLAPLINILWVLLIWLVLIQFALRPGAREPE